MAPLWVLVTEGGQDALATWAAGFRRSPADRARIDNRLGMLRLRSLKLLLSSGLVRQTDCVGVYQLPLENLRKSVLLFCLGPLPGEMGFTLLAGGEESESGLTAQGLLDAACEGRDAILRDPERRRKQYERLG